MPFAPLTTSEQILERARDAFEAYRTHDEVREEMRENLKARRNDLWSDEAKALRKGSRPMYNFNIVDRIVDGIAGDARENPIQISFLPTSGQESFHAMLLEGVVKAIQYRSQSQRAFAWALECAASLCEGYFRLRIDYESDRSLRPTLRIERVPDAFMVGMDPHDFTEDGSGSDWQIILHKFVADDFRTLWPGKEPQDVDLTSDVLRYWYEMTGKDGKSVTRYLVAEFYWREYVEKWIGETPGGFVVDLDGEPIEHERNRWAQVRGSWVLVDDARKARTNRIRGVFVAGHTILEGPFDWPGRNFPCYRVSGKEVIGDGKRTVKSAISNARDPNKVLNTTFTGAAEAVNANTVGKWVATWRSVKKYWDKWWTKSNDPSQNLLPYDPDPQAPNGGRPDWVSPPVQLQGQFAMGAQALDLVRYTTNVGEEATGLRSNAVSGKAIIARQRASNTATIAFLDNLQGQIELCGRELAHLVPLYYRGSRTVQAVLEEDETIPRPIPLRLGQPLSPQDAAWIRAVAERKKIPVPEVLESLELREGEYDVVSDAAKSWVTRRVEAQELLLGLASSTPPPYFPPLFRTILKFTDAPGAEDLARQIEEREQMEMQAASKGQGKPPSESLNYKDAPPDVQRQIEAQAGLQPSQMVPVGLTPGQGPPPGGPPGTQITPEDLAMMGFDPTMMGQGPGGMP